MDDIDTIFIEATNIKKQLPQMKKHHTRTNHTKQIKVRSSVEVAQDNYKATRRLQKANIKRAKQQIKSYKLLIKQARTTYKLIKLSK